MGGDVDQTGHADEMYNYIAANRRNNMNKSQACQNKQNQCWSRNDRAKTC